MKSRLFGKSGSLFKEAAILMIEAPKRLDCLLEHPKSTKRGIIFSVNIASKCDSTVIDSVIEPFSGKYFFLSYFAYPRRVTNCDTRSKFVGLDKLANPIDGVRGKAFVKLRAIAGNVCESKPIKSWDLKRMQNDQSLKLKISQRVVSLGCGE